MPDEPSTSPARRADRREKTEATVAVLLEQYKIAEERRAEFGRQFMQTAGFVTALVAAAVGLLSVKNPSLLRVACAAGGGLFLANALLGYRLGARQDDCEKTLGEVERALRTLGHTEVVSLRPGAGFGARKLLVGYMAALGLALLAAALLIG